MSCLSKNLSPAFNIKSFLVLTGLIAIFSACGQKSDFTKTKEISQTETELGKSPTSTGFNLDNQNSEREPAPPLADFNVRDQSSESPSPTGLNPDSQNTERKHRPPSRDQSSESPSPTDFNPGNQNTGGESSPFEEGELGGTAPTEDSNLEVNFSDFVSEDVAFFRAKSARGLRDVECECFKKTFGFINKSVGFVRITIGDLLEEAQKEARLNEACQTIGGKYGTLNSCLAVR